MEKLPNNLDECLDMMEKDIAAHELTPPNIDGVDKKYLDLFNNINNESRD